MQTEVWRAMARVNERGGRGWRRLTDGIASGGADGLDLK